MVLLFLFYNPQLFNLLVKRKVDNAGGKLEVKSKK